MLFDIVKVTGEPKEIGKPSPPVDAVLE